MGVLAGAVVAIYYLGAIVALFAVADPCGGNPQAYVVAFMHEPPRRNGIPWVLKSFGKWIAWPVVFWQWWQAGRPPSPVLYGDAAAEAMAIDPDSLSYTTYNFATKWMRPKTEPSHQPSHVSTARPP